MFRNCALLIAVVMALAWHSPARASSDFECSPGLKLNHTAMTGCDNMVILQPGNDTRVNLTLLLLDREHAAPIRLVDEILGESAKECARSKLHDFLGQLERFNWRQLDACPVGENDRRNQLARQPWSRRHL